MSKPDVKQDTDESSATTDVSSARRASSLMSVRLSIPAATATAKRYLNRAEELLDEGRDITVGASKARPLTLVAAVLVLHTLFSEEVACRRQTRLMRAVRAAQFPFLRTVDEFDFISQSTLRLTTIGSLLSPDFVTEGRTAIRLGRPGRGKTHLAIAIAFRALRNGFDARFTTAAELIDDLSNAGREGRMREVLAGYVRPHVLVADEVGYLTYGDDAANVLYHVVNDRHIWSKAILFTSNKHPKRWGAALHDEDLADAIVDRILGRGCLLRLDGPSARTKHLPGDELTGNHQDDLTSRRVSGKDAAELPEPTVLIAA